MVSPMREKRTWPPQDKDSDGETVAAFEAAVAVVKETVVRSGEVLVSAKEDLSDHQRWLKAQTAKVQADRERHERFLRRQRERQEALARREQKRARRRAQRQAAAQGIKRAVVSAVFAVRSTLWLAFAKTRAGLTYIDAQVASGARWLAVGIRDLATYLVRAVWQGVSLVGAKLRALVLGIRASVAIFAAKMAAKAHAAALSVSNFLSLYFGGLAARGRDVSRAIGRAFGTSLSALSAKTDEMTRSAGQALRPALSSIGARAHQLAPGLTERIAQAGHGARCHVGTGAERVRALLAQAFGTSLSALSAKTDELTRSAGQALRPALSTIGARAHQLAPGLTERIAQAGHVAGRYGRAGAERVHSLLARNTAQPAEAPLAEAAPAEAPLADAIPIEAENELSLPSWAGRFDLSQMLIIAGALLLVCGGLMLGGGLMLRAKTPASSPLAAATPAEPIAWLYEHPSLPLDERSVFVFDTTPDGLRIKGFAIGAVNMSDQSLASLGGVLKPDRRDHDLRLDLNIVSEEPAEGAGSAEAQPVPVLPEGTIPSQAPFKLVFLFPAEEGAGLTPQQVLSTYGGLMLKIHYEIDGTQRSFIQYLPASLLEEQLAEIGEGS
jgi:hypothetical protein